MQDIFVPYSDHDQKNGQPKTEYLRLWSLSRPKKGQQRQGIWIPDTKKSSIQKNIFEAEKLPAKAFIIVWAGMYSSCLRSKLDWTLTCAYQP